MPRVASLYLPSLPIERLRRIEGSARGQRPEPFLLPAEVPPDEKKENRIDCSCPRGGGWRPGARWAKSEDKRTGQLPLHQRPTMRELGRRTEPAEAPFRRARNSLSAAFPSPVPASGRPLVTVRREGQRMVIAAACPVAAELGLHPGMAVTQAQAMVPGLDTHPADPAADGEMLAALAAFAIRRWTPHAAPSDETGLWLDFAGVAHLFGGEAALCSRIRRFCARMGYSTRIAVADTPGAAHALARHSDLPVVFCAAGEEAEALAPLPLEALRVGEDELSAARRLGLERIGDLLALPRAPLTRRFGKSLLKRLDQATGRLPEPWEPLCLEEMPVARVRFAEPIATAEAIAEAMAELMRRLVATLEQRGLAARELLLRCERIDREVQSVAIGTARATRDGAHLHRLLADRIERIEPGYGIEAMELVARHSEPLAPAARAPLLAGEPERPDLVPLLDRIAGRIGRRRLFRMTALESEIPERSLAAIAPLDPVQRWPDPWPRPIRLLSPPERIENVVALLPDQPPRRFTWRGRTHKVRRADGPERIFGEWWKSGREAEAVRDYFQVEDENGARFWLYRRGDGEQARTGDLSWYLHGLFA